MDDGSLPALHSCPACRAIDLADGVEDGKLYKTVHFPVRSERRIVNAIKRTEDRVADRVTAFAGSLNFVYIHTVWFGLWIALNAGVLGASLVFDEFPYGLLTMVVSLEAIFLATIVMVSQNRQTARADIRSDLDFENNLRSEIWAIHIGHALGIDTEHVETVVRAALDGYRTEQAPPTKPQRTPDTPDRTIGARGLQPPEPPLTDGPA